MIEYKGYTPRIEVDFEANIIFGVVDGIRDVITFEGATPEEAAQAFRDSVDTYLAYCEEAGRIAQRPEPVAA